MATSTQNDLKIKNAENFIDSLDGTEGDARSYMFIGKATPWDVASVSPLNPRVRAGETSPPYPENNFKDVYQIHNDMLSLIRIRGNEVFYMIPRYRWTSGLIYDLYRHDYNDLIKSYSGASNLYDCRYYVITGTRDVYVCLDNNNNSPSIVEPQSITDEPFYTSDGYQWMRLYKIPMEYMRIYSTNNFVPITTHEVAKKPEGAVYTVAVNASGSQYTSSPAGLSNLVPHYFCRIVGDGDGAVARVTIINGRVFRVQVERPGSGYTYGRVDFSANRVFVSLIDLDANSNSLNPLGDGRFDATVIMSPPGGWGYEILKNTAGEESECKKTLARQLGGTRVGVFSTLKYNQNDFIKDTKFRQIGILHDPKGSFFLGRDNVYYYPETLSAHYAVKIKEVLGSEFQNYKIGERIMQQHEDAIDKTIKYTSYGTVVGWDHINNIIRYVQDPMKDLDPVHNQLLPFSGSETIIGESTGKESTPDVDYNLVRNYGDNEYDIIGMEFISGYSTPEFDKYSGLITYVTNISPIQRSPQETERISLLISY